jgi:hypothetical protein
MRPATLAVGLTLLLGATVGLAWGVAGGSIAFRGPYWALAEHGLAIYGLVAILAMAITSVAFHRFGRGLSLPTGALVVVAAWLGQGLVLYVGGRLIANEVTGVVAGLFWLLGTGGPIQPLAAVAGVLLARRLAARPPVAHSAGDW